MPCKQLTLKLRNRDSAFVEPSIGSLPRAVALTGRRTGFAVVLTDQPGKDHGP